MVIRKLACLLLMAGCANDSLTIVKTLHHHNACLYGYCLEAELKVDCLMFVSPLPNPHSIILNLILAPLLSLSLLGVL